ncbi:hypothetical protein C8J56DRAFT_961076 [Mycena floridula]|nr:hypothetical protein C8J56DRAFT_961076 [Mycena floridula]
MVRIDLTNTFGSGFIGAMFTAALYGLTTLQTYLFFVYYPNDILPLRLFVAAIWVLDTAQTSLVGVCMYHYLVANYDNPVALSSGHWSLFLSMAMNVIVAVMVQSFFTLQIFTLCSRKVRWWVSSAIFLTVIGHFCFGIATVIIFFKKKTFAEIQAPEVILDAATPFAAFDVVSDILISVALCILLYGSRSGISATNTLISTLILYAINRCLLTSVVAVVEVITFSLSPKSLWFLAIDFTIGKLYANSALASLNSRRSLRGTASETKTEVINLRSSTVQFSSGSDASSKPVNPDGHVLHFGGDGSRATTADWGQTSAGESRAEDELKTGREGIV